jgi:hypothetical protein
MQTVSIIKGSFRDGIGIITFDPKGEVFELDNNKIDN